MKFRFILPLLALSGFGLAIKTTIDGSHAVPMPEPLAEPGRPPFETFVAGAGVVESRSEDIAIGTPVGGVVDQVFAAVGQKIKKGDALFKLDDRQVLADLGVRRAELEDLQNELSLWQKVNDARAVSVDNLNRKRYAVGLAVAKLRQAETELDRLTVRAPIDGEILRVKVKPGEYAPPGVLSTALITMGDTENLHLRIDIDENDAWRFEPNRPAVAFMRGNPRLSLSLNFVRFEPYVVPKRSLTGESSERVDTRVLQVIYSFSRQDFPVYIGQLLDAFVEAKPLQAGR